MISYKHKFILITPQKTGSVSLVTALMDYINITDVKIQRGEECFDFSDEFGCGTSKHAGMRDYISKWKKSLGAIEDYQIFGAIRNPYDRMVSFWKWSGQKDTFSEYLKNPRNQPVLGVLMKGKISHKGSIYAKDFIRLENIQEDFNLFCDKVEIPRKQLPHKNQSNHKHYTEYYDDETREIVEDKYAEDIEYFGYEFGDQTR